MTISYVGAGTALDSAASGSFSLGYPAGIATDDLLVVPIVMKSSSDTAPPPSSSLTWTQQATHGTFQKIWTAAYDGSAAAPTIAVNGHNLAARMFAFRGIDLSSILLGTPTTSFVTQTNMRFPALTVPSDNGVVITFCKANGAITSVAPASGFTEIWDLNASASAMGVHAQYQIQTTATDIAQTDLVVTGGSSVSQTGITLAFNAIRAITWPQYTRRPNPLITL